MELQTTAEAGNAVNGGPEPQLRERKLRLERLSWNFVCEMQFHVVVILLFRREAEVGGTLRDRLVQHMPVGNETPNTGQRDVKTLIYF